LVGALDGYYWKPVQAGLDGETDSELVQRLSGLPAGRILPEVYRLTTAASPHLAAERDGIVLDIEGPRRRSHDPRAFGRHRRGRRTAGAADPQLLQIELFARWGSPVVLVAATRLGTINHTLLSIEALRRRGIPLLGSHVRRRRERRFGAHDCRDGGRPSPRAPADRRFPRQRNVALRIRRQLRCRRLPYAGDGMTSGNASPIWHPFTQHALHPEMIPVSGARGAWLKTRDGGLILDAISSWWVVTHGHCHPRIVGAIEEQARRLDQVIFAGFTHAPAEMLARGLIEVAPPGLAHVFYSDSGSTAVEVALKMALGYFRNIAAPRRRIVALEHGYHGDTVGGMSVGARGVFSAAYEPLLFDVARIPFPPEGREQATIDAFDAACAAEPVAALIVEPLILGAGGMRIYSEHVLRELKRVAEAHGALFIADEVMTGWGRTGELFACGKAGVAPDILCTAKGITGGSLPLAATLCTVRHLRGAPLHRPDQDVLPFKLLHGESHRLRRCSGQSRHLADRADGRAACGARRHAGRAPWLRLPATTVSPTRARSARSRRSICRCRMPATSPGSARGLRATSSSARCCCGRSAIRSM
jgi:acetylornithine/succinyldiaminopimelate/putrescine aminotransferase